jgi:hypothetical protein
VDALTLISQGSSRFELQGEERLGSALTVVPSQPESPELGKCKFQWQRIHGLKAEPIIGNADLEFLCPHGVLRWK